MIGLWNLRGGVDFDIDDTDAEPALERVSPLVMARLEAWAEQTQGDIAAADAKASTLLGWSGTALALVSTVLATLGVRLPPVGWPVMAIGLAGLLALAGAVLALILVIRPRLGGRRGTSTTGDRSFLFFTTVPASTVLAAARADSRDDVDPARALERVQVLSAIAWAKHHLVRTACTLLVASMPLLAIAGTALALAGGQR